MRVIALSTHSCPCLKQLETKAGYALGPLLYAQDEKLERVAPIVVPGDIVLVFVESCSLRGRGVTGVSAYYG